VTISNVSMALSAGEPFILRINYDPRVEFLSATINDGSHTNAGAEMETPPPMSTVDAFFAARGATGVSLHFAGAVSMDYDHAVPIGTGIIYNCADPEHKFEHNW
jgi:hypothetical protein